MRLFALCLLAVVAAAQQQTPEPPQKARIEGSVVSLTGEPIPRAQVRLQGTANIQAGQITQPSVYNATAGDDGKWAIDDIEPGRNYQLTAQRPGFVNARYGARSANTPGAPLAIEAGQTLTGFAIVMTPQATISGKVTDQAGDPVQNAQVLIARRGYQRGVRQLLPLNSAQTNDQGEYRAANLPPGRYYIMAVDRLAMLQPGSSGNANLVTYFPNGAEPESAAPVDLGPGTELRGMDIRFRQGKVYTIRGKAVDANGAAAIGAIVTTQPPDVTNTLTLLATQRVSAQARPPDGAFELRGVAPGTHTLVTLNPALNNTTAPRLSGRQEVTVVDSDLSGLVFTLGGGATVTGTVRLENGDLKTLFAPAGANAGLVTVSGVAIPANGGRLNVALQDLSGAGLSTVTAQAKDDGTFTFEGVAPSRYTFAISGLPQTAFVKAVRFGGSDVTKTELDLRSGAGGALDVVVSDKAADVAGGILLDQDQEAKDAVGVMVTLWPEDAEPGLAGGFRTATSDQNGGFQFRGLRPGRYYVAAWEDVDPGLVQSRDFAMQFTGEAEKLEITEGGHAATTVKIIPAAKIKAAEEKLP